MKNYILILLFLTLALPIKAQYTRMEKSNDSLLRHMVLFSFKKETSPNKISEISNAFKALPQKIQVIKDFEWGLNNSPEGLNKGFTHCFFVTFESEKDREIYLPHPAHQDFVKLLDNQLEDVLVVDYWTKN